MKKLFLLSFTDNAFSHTELESSTPQNGEVIIEELQEIILNFEGKIENDSTFTLENATGVEST